MIDPFDYDEGDDQEDQFGHFDDDLMDSLFPEETGDDEDRDGHEFGDGAMDLLEEIEA